MSESVGPRAENEEKAPGKHPEVVHGSSESQMDGTVTETKPPGYSKLSVVSMVLFSGLAIGSDGYNSSVIGNLALVVSLVEALLRCLTRRADQTCSSRHSTQTRMPRCLPVSLPPL